MELLARPPVIRRNPLPKYHLREGRAATSQEAFQTEQDTNENLIADHSPFLINHEKLNSG